MLCSTKLDRSGIETHAIARRRGGQEEEEEMDKEVWQQQWGQQCNASIFLPYMPEGQMR